MGLWDVHHAVSINPLWRRLYPTGLDAVAKARHALSLIERLRSLLAAASASAAAVLQPTAAALAAALDIEGRESQLGPVSLLAEEVVRGSAAAALSLLLAAVEPR